MECLSAMFSEVSVSKTMHLFINKHFNAYLFMSLDFVSHW